MDRQLTDGVRGFMLDIHQTPDGAILCHDSCTLVSRPVALWVDLQRMVDFLGRPNQFVACTWRTTSTPASSGPNSPASTACPTSSTDPTAPASGRAAGRSCPP